MPAKAYGPYPPPYALTGIMSKNVIFFFCMHKNIIIFPQISNHFPPSTKTYIFLADNNFSPL